MAKIKDLTHQLQFTGAGEKFNDTIRFYNKSLNGVIIIGVRAESDKLILHSVNVNGRELEDLETFDYSSIKEPISSDIEDLVEKVNVFIRSEPIKKTIDSIYTSIVTNTSGLNRCDSYRLNPNDCTVECFDDDIDSILFVFNETRNKVLYMLGSEEYTGSMDGNILTYDVKVNGIDNLDKLYLLYKATPDISEQSYLRDMKSIMEQNLVQSTLIAMILSESFGSALSSRDIKYNNNVN